MRVHIISDMEGVSGIARREQTNAGMSMFEEGRKLYTEDINAAVRGAKAAGATEIVVVDCHGAGEGFTFNSLIAEELEPSMAYRQAGVALDEVLIVGFLARRCVPVCRWDSVSHTARRQEGAQRREAGREASRPAREATSPGERDAKPGSEGRRQPGNPSSEITGRRRRTLSPVLSL